MNLFNTKDNFLIKRDDFWTNPYKDLVMDRDGNVHESSSKMIPTSNKEEVDAIKKKFENGRHRLKVVDDDY